MRASSVYFSIGLIGIASAGCATAQPLPAPAPRPAISAAPAPPVVQAAYSTMETVNKVATLPPLELSTKAVPSDEDCQPIELRDLIELTLDRNPRLGQVAWAVEAARGLAVQAGLYPNPTASVTGNEISDRTGPSGIWSAYASQEIVTASKLELSQAAALKQVDQRSLNLMAERYEVFTDVRQAFFEALTLQRRAEILKELVKLAEESTANAEKLLQAKEAAELDVVQLEVDLERYRAELEATQRALPAAYQKLAASVGVENMPICRVTGDLDTPLPDYDLNQIRTYVLGIHPELRAAQIGVERAKLVLCRAEVEPIPNVTVGTGFTYQGQNRSSDWDIGVSLPIPLWNKNQGNILAARAQVNEALNQVGRVENELVNRLATSFTGYAAARERSERYKNGILPKARRTYQLSLKGYQGGQFEYLRVLQAQRAMAEANLELIRSLGEMWHSASEIAGLMLEDQWPPGPDMALPERSQP